MIAKRFRLVLIVVIASLDFAACAPAAPAASPPTTVLVTAPPVIPAAAPTGAPSLAPTTVAATVAPTAAAAPTLAPSPTPATASNAQLGGDLSVAEMGQMFRDSVTAYPWRWRESVTSKATQKSADSLIEAQSSTRAHTISQQPVGSNMVVLESILITPTLYMKVTGATPDVLAQFGAGDGQWVKVPPDSPLQAFAQTVYLAANPVELLASMGVLDALKQADPNARPYKSVGMETVNGVRTTVYEVVKGTGDAAATSRISVGADRRIYKMNGDNARGTLTITVEYDPSMNIQPPMP